MPLRIINGQIAELEARMKELEAESARLEAQLEELKHQRDAIGVNDDTQILKGVDGTKRDDRQA